MTSHERLESKVDRIDPGIKLHVAIAAKGKLSFPFLDSISRRGFLIQLSFNTR